MALFCMTSGFRRDIDENRDLLGYHAGSSGNFLQTFRDTLSVPSSGRGDPLKMGPICCPVITLNERGSRTVPQFTRETTQNITSSRPAAYPISVSHFIALRICVVMNHVKTRWTTCGGGRLQQEGTKGRHESLQVKNSSHTVNFLFSLYECAIRLEFCEENANWCLLGLVISVQQGLTDNEIPSHISMPRLPRITYSRAA